MQVKWLSLFLYLLIINYGRGCLSPSPLTLQLILEYASWRSWDQLVLFDEFESSDCALEYAKPFLKCLSEKGISVSIQSASNPKLPDALEIQRHRIGSVVLLDGLNLTSSDNVLKVIPSERFVWVNVFFVPKLQASNKRLFNYYVSWFLITNQNEDAIIDTTLSNLTIGINTDVVVATAFPSGDEAQTSTRLYLNRTCSGFQMYAQKFSFTTWMNKNDRSLNENITKNLDYSIIENRTMAFYLVHVYKIRITDNSSLIVHPLGAWNPRAHTLKFPLSTEMRNNFNGLKIIVGVLNGTSDGQPKDEMEIEEEASQVQPLHDFIGFLNNSLNASMEMEHYEKLGTVTNKVSSNLLGDVYTGKVDIGLGYITITEERQRDMSFTHPLIRYTRNIYIRPPESGTMRDIFLQPFNNRMLFCVALMHFLIIVAIGTINYAAKNILDTRNKKCAGIGEATLWCMSILCMQGSSWSPTSISGKTALLASLVFSLVTYNAYAGFITSILSVQASGIRTLEDVLRNNFKLGYSEIDDEYMRNANDSDLRQLYIKAFNNREAGLDTNVGLQKAMKGGYGFFASATLARRALGTCLIHERCTIKEIEVGHTFTTVALPMEKASPYEKIINHSVLRMRERGVIDRISEKMLPAMPKCEALTTFHSARIADVYSAFIILMIGAVTSLCLGLFERIWDQRRSVQRRIIHGVINRRAGLLRWGHSHTNFQQENIVSSNEAPIIFPFPKYHMKKRALETDDEPGSLSRTNRNETKFQSLFKFRRISGSLGLQRATEGLEITEQRFENERTWCNVYSAFIILMIGAVTSLCLGLFERIWDQRRSVQRRIIHGVINRRAGLLRWGHSHTNFQQENIVSSNEAPIIFPFPKYHMKKRALETDDEPGSLSRTNRNETKFQSLFKFRRISGSLGLERATEGLEITEQVADLTISKKVKRRRLPFHN